MMSVKQAAVAGTFYPDDPKILRETLQNLLCSSVLGSLPQPKAMIVPHAGYIFSGPVAANAYKVLANMAHIKHIVLIGPSHYVAVDGAVLPTQQLFRTPLGDISVNLEFVSKLLKLPQVGLLDEAFSREHSLEVQLPFLQMSLNDFTITPVLVGRVDKQVVATILEQFWQREDTLFIISSDLSHYHDYKTALARDQQTMQAILNLDADALAVDQACGCFAIKGLLHFAKQHHLHAQLIDMRNSGDTKGDKTRVVGYGAVHFYQHLSLTETLKVEDEPTLINLAKSSIEYGIKHRQQGQIVLDKLPAIFHYHGATFVTLNKHDQLRGCIGSLEAKQPLAADVVRNAYAAAFEDPRFPPLQENELSDISIDISLLSELTPIIFNNEQDLLAQLRPHIDGVLLADIKHRGVFLPLVWDKLSEPEVFWQALKQKAQMPPDYWSDSMKAWRFTTRVIV